MVNTAKNKENRLTGAALAGAAAGAALAYLVNEDNRKKAMNKAKELGEMARDQLEETAPEAVEKAKKVPAYASEVGRKARGKARSFKRSRR